MIAQRRLKRRLSQLLARMLLPLLLGALVVMAYERQWLQALDVLLYDGAQALRPATILEHSVVIAIDEQSIEQLGRWPWPRAQHAELIHQLTRSGATAIVFDVLFADASTPQDDLALANAIAQHGRVVLPMSIEPLSDSGQLIEVLPIASLFRAAYSVGHAHIDCDYDGVCRSFYLREGLGGAVWPHLSATLLPASQALPGTRARESGVASPLWIYRDYHNFIPFSAHDHVPMISYVDVIAGRVPQGFLNGKRVFVGATAAGVHDILTTPVGRQPGVEITALIDHHLLAGTLVKQYRGAAFAFCMGVAVVLLLSALSLLPPGPFLLATLLCAAVQYAIFWALLMGAQQWLAVAPVMVVTVLFYPLWSWLRLELAVAYLKRSLVLRQQHPSPVSGVFNTEQASIASTPWLMGSDTVARTVNQLDIASATQEAAHQLLQQSVSGLQEGCIIFDSSGGCYLTNALAKQWLPLWHSQNVNDLGAVLSLPIIDWPAAINGVFNDQQIICCEASAAEMTYWLQVKNCPIQLPGRTHKIVVGVLTLTNISALKASERAREETLNFISHDLRSPLVSILSLITHQRERAWSAAEADALLAQIEYYANRNLAYSESLLQLNRAEQIVPEKTTGMCDLFALCEDAYAQVLPFAQSKNCLLKQDYGDDDYWVTGDYELLQRALVNLLTNAVKYGASPRGVILKLSRAAEESIGVDSGPKAQISVQDFGVGFSAEQQRLAFQRFSRKGSADDTGAGLGLFFVKTVLVNHGGSVTLNSEPNKGCSVICTLPLQPLDFLSGDDL